MQAEQSLQFEILFFVHRIVRHAQRLRLLMLLSCSDTITSTSSASSSSVMIVIIITISSTRHVQLPLQVFPV